MIQSYSMVFGILILFGITCGQSGSFEDCYNDIKCSEYLEFIIPNKQCSATFTYAIVNSECKIKQDESRENDQIVSFFDEKCVSKTINENEPGFIYYALTLELTNQNIIVTGPEKITIECKVPNVKEIDLSSTVQDQDSIDCDTMPCIYSYGNTDIANSSIGSLDPELIIRGIATDDCKAESFEETRKFTSDLIRTGCQSRQGEINANICFRQYCQCNEKHRQVSILSNQWDCESAIQKQIFNVSIDQAIEFSFPDLLEIESVETRIDSAKKLAQTEFENILKGSTVFLSLSDNRKRRQTAENLKLLITSVASITAVNEPFESETFLITFDISCEYDVYIIEADNVETQLQSATSNQLNDVGTSLTDSINVALTDISVPSNFIIPDSLKSFPQDSVEVLSGRTEFEQKEENQKKVQTFEIKVLQPIVFEVARSSLTDDSQESLRRWAEDKLRELLVDLKLRDSNPEVLLKISEKDDSKTPSVVTALKLRDNSDGSSVVKVDFDFEFYSIPGGVEINLKEIGIVFLAKLKERAEKDSENVTGKLLVEKLPKSFDFYDANKDSQELQSLNQNREKVLNYLETARDDLKCGLLDDPCLYVLIDGEYMPKNNLDTKCNKDLLKFPRDESETYRDEYIPTECQDQTSNTECYRRPCNCELEVDDSTNQAVSIQLPNTWQCLPPSDPIVTSNTVFLSPSPMNYTLGENDDQNAEMNRLEISFGASFTQPTTIRLKGKPVTLKPKNIQIIGVLGVNEPLGGNKQSRTITRFAQRSMMHSLILYSQRNNSTDLKRKLYLGAEFEFEGYGSDRMQVN